MTSRLSRATFLTSLPFLLLPLVAPPAMAAPADDPPEAVVKKMLEALKSNSYEGFLEHASDAVRSGISKQMFEGLNGVYGTRLRQGYKALFLTRLKQKGHNVYLWKLEYQDGKDDDLLRLVMKDGKVAGVFFQ